MQANNLPNPSFIHVGQRLLIPDVAAPPVLRYENARIAFARWDGGKHDLYIANTDGSHEELLLERAAGPSWSPGARSLSFFGEEGVDHQMQNGVSVDFEGISNGIVVASLPHRPGDLNQLKLVQIKQEGSARATAWSPNGKAIAWDARPGGGYRIYFDGEEGTDFDAQSAVEIVGEHPDWSPDSSKIVYRSGRDGKQGLWISDRFDSVAVRITEDGSDAFPSWSPDGRWIAFQREADDNVDIYIMPAPGATPGHESSPRPVGPDGPPQGPQGGPPHPPQGDGRPGGSYVRRLTHARGPDTLPAWTPDGHIVFRSARAGSWGIYIMNVDGMGQQQIIPHADPGPDWTLGRMDLHPIR
jgi:dipeptidyl aminopeptidase/acylaminoacyl peptidase